MRAIVFRRYGPPEVLRLEEVAKPVPADGEVLIRVHAATVATADCEMRGFTLLPWQWLPVRLMFGVLRPRRVVQILGQELAGEIEAVGKDVRTFKAGDKVMAAIAGFGAHAEYKCLPADAAITAKPPNCTYAEAATFSTFALNALHFIRKAALKPGKHIAINGAGSSIGTPAVQLAKHFGAEITAIDSAGKLDMLRAIGADHVVDYAREDFTRHGGVYDVILDVVGKSPYGRSVRALREEGLYILANPTAAAMLRSLSTNRQGTKKVLFAMAGARSPELTALKELVEAGALKAVIDRSFPIEEIVAAHRYVGSGQKRGNVILEVSNAAHKA